MLGRTNSLLFPRLVHIKEIKNFKTESKIIHLYKLDWSGMEEICKQHHEQRRKSQRENEELNQRLAEKEGREFETAGPRPYGFFSALPKDEMKLVDDFQFAITPDYRREIIRNTKRASAERNIERRFDTAIRDMCGMTCVAHAEVAFKLLGDCLYDPETNCFSRDYCLKNMAPKLMSYRLWFHQTGRGLIWYRANLDKLEDGLSGGWWCKSVGAESIKRYKEYLKKLKDHLEAFEKHMFEGATKEVGVKEAVTVESMDEELKKLPKDK